MKICHTFRELGAWMLWHHDVEEMCLKFGNNECIPLSRSLSRLTGLPYYGKQVVEIYSDNSMEYFKTSLGIPMNEKHWNKYIINRILDGLDDDLFVTCWTLILVDKIFAPTTSLSVSKRLLETCLDVNNIMSYDWVGYIMEAVRKSAKKLQKDRSATFAYGSTYFLGLYLLDWLKHPGLTPPIGEPRFTLWHDEDFGYSE